MRIGRFRWSAPCAAVLLCGVAPAQGSLAFEFDGGGLPSSHPDVCYFGSLSEGSVFSIQSGVLEQRAAAATGSAFYYAGTLSGNPRCSNPPFSVSPLLDAVLEVRARVLLASGSVPTFAEFNDGQSSHSMVFAVGEVRLSTTEGVLSHALDTSVFHTYRLETPGGSTQVDLYVDGMLVLTGTAPALAGYDDLAFGDPFSGAADVDWDYVRFTQTTPAAAYCTAKTNACGPGTASVAGVSSAASASGFEVLGAAPLGGRIGVLLYNEGAAPGAPYLPFGGAGDGVLCVKIAGMRHARGTASGGVPGACGNGALFAVDMNAYAAGALGGSPAAYLSTPGATVHCQWWGREAPGSAYLSEGLEYDVGL